MSSLLPDDFAFPSSPTGLRPRKKPEVVLKPKTKYVWVILSQWTDHITDEGDVALQQFGVFPYKEKSRAEACAELLQRHDLKGTKYHVQAIKVPME